MDGLMKKTVLIMLIIALICTPVCVFAGSDGSPDGYDSWDDFYASVTGEGTAEVSDYVPVIGEMKLLANENGAELYFYEDENIFYVRSGGRIWSSIIDPEKISVNGLETAEWRNLFTVKVTDSTNSVKIYELSSGSASEFEISHEYGNNSVILHITVPEVSVSFDAVIGLDGDGLYCTIPDSSIKETEEYRLMSIIVLPCFGAAPVTDDGYIVYADGCGALIDFSGREDASRNVSSYQVWGSETADLDKITSNETDDIHSLLLPIAGVKHTVGASLAAVTSGEEIVTLNILHGRYYNAYFSFEYRTFYSADYNFTGSVFDKKQITKLSSRRAEGIDCTVRWFIFNGDKNTYSDIAVRYREYLIGCGQLKANEHNGDIPVSLDIFTGIKKSGLLGESVYVMTDYAQATEMLRTLTDSGVKAVDVRLMGWNKDGYTAMPTSLSGETKVGSAKTFEKYCSENSISLYKDAEWIKAAVDSSGYNGQKDVLRDCIQQIVTDKQESAHLLSSRRIFLSRTAEWSKKSDVNVCLSSVGTWLLSGFDASGEFNRSDALKSYLTGMETLKNDTDALAVVGGNSYVLPFADRLYEIPDTDSSYYQNTRTVPFYQMVVHGFTDYSSLAGNRSFDLDYQKLKWIETGSLPHYFVTNEPSVKFQDTDYDTVFSSRFSDYQDIIIQVSQEFNRAFGEFWYEPINRHEFLSKDLVRVTYGSDHAVIINYGDTSAQADGVEIPAKNYVVTEVKNQ